MAGGDNPQRSALGAAGALVFLGTVAFTVLAQVFGPMFGVSVGTVPDTVLAMLIVSFLVLVGAVSGSVLERWRRNGGT